MTNNRIVSQQLLQQLPNADLHLHLDGSMRMSTLIALAKQQTISLPSYSTAGLRDTVFKQRYRNLSEYLQGFAYTCAVLRHPHALQQVAYELAQDCLAEGVYYLEVRLAPQLHMQAGFSIAHVLQAVQQGLQQAASQHNSSKAVQLQTAPPFHFGILVCAMRMFHAGFGPYYRHLLATTSHLHTQQIYSHASLDLVKQSVMARDRLGVCVVGLDLAGLEPGHPAKHHHQAYQFAHAAGLYTTVHAGEVADVANIKHAIYHLRSHRLGHATYLYGTTKPKRQPATPHTTPPNNLRALLQRQQIPVEVCISSNIQTLPALRTVYDHPIQHMLRDDLAITICTDNRLVSHTCVTNELQQVCSAFRLTLQQLRSLVLRGFESSFFPGTRYQKRHYIKQVTRYCDYIFAMAATTSPCTSKP